MGRKYNQQILLSSHDLIEKHHCRAEVRLMLSLGTIPLLPVEISSTAPGAHCLSFSWCRSVTQSRKQCVRVDEIKAPDFFKIDPPQTCHLPVSLYPMLALLFLQYLKKSSTSGLCTCCFLLWNVPSQIRLGSTFHSLSDPFLSKVSKITYSLFPCPAFFISLLMT